MNEVMLGAAAPSRPINIFVATSYGEGENDAKGNKKERKKAGNHAKRDDITQEDIGEEDRSSEQDRRSRRNKLCKSTKHWTDACPDLAEIVAAYKAGKAAEATDERDQIVGFHHMDSRGLLATDFVVF